MGNISCVTEGGVAVISMDDGKANAMNFDFFESLDGALDRALAEGARAVVFEGRGRFFSGGLDLKLVPTLAPADLKRLAVRFGEAILRVWGFEVPTIAALEGYAVAGGAILSFACDRRLARAGPGLLHVNEAAIGIPLPSWAVHIGEGAVPVRWQTQVLLHSVPLSWQEAADKGLVDELIEEGGDLRGRAVEIAMGLTTLNLKAYSTIKSRMRTGRIQAALALLEAELDELLPT